MKISRKKSGSIEKIPSAEELEIKNKVKDKKPKDLTDSEVKDLVYLLAKNAGLL